MKIIKRFFFLILRVIGLFGIMLFVANVLWLSYCYIGKFLAKVHDSTDKNKVYANVDKIMSVNFKETPDKTFFLQNCNNLPADMQAGGRFMININKICLNDSSTKYSINHELVHYNLWNLSPSQKLDLRGEIKDQIILVKKAMKTLDPNKLTGDDLRFYESIKKDVYDNAQDKIYSFYDRVADFVITYRGNEEYITYAIGTVIDISHDNKMYFIKYDLRNPLLKDVYEGYHKVYSKITNI